MFCWVFWFHFEKYRLMVNVKNIIIPLINWLAIDKLKIKLFNNSFWFFFRVDGIPIYRFPAVQHFFSWNFFNYFRKERNAAEDIVPPWVFYFIFHRPLSYGKQHARSQKMSTSPNESLMKHCNCNTVDAA